MKKIPYHRLNSGVHTDRNSSATSPSIQMPEGGMCENTKVTKEEDDSEKKKKARKNYFLPVQYQVTMRLPRRKRQYYI